MTQEEVLKVLENVEHPAIRYSLIKLGIVRDIKLVGNKVYAVFAWPFPNIPIADTLIHSIDKPLMDMDLILDYSVRVMNDHEKNSFLQMETEAWKG